MAKETIAYKVKDRDDCGYLTVEKDGEDVVVHPETKKDSLVEHNSSGYPDYIMIPTEDRFHTKNIHSTRCRCKKCSGLMDKLLGFAKDNDMPVTFTIKDTK